MDRDVCEKEKSEMDEEEEQREEGYKVGNWSRLEKENPSGES